MPIFWVHSVSTLHMLPRLAGTLSGMKFASHAFPPIFEASEQMGPDPILL